MGGVYYRWGNDGQTNPARVRLRERPCTRPVQGSPFSAARRAEGDRASREPRRTGEPRRVPTPRETRDPRPETRVYGTETLSKFAGAVDIALRLVTARPMWTPDPIGIVWLPTSAHVAPSADW